MLGRLVSIFIFLTIVLIQAAQAQTPPTDDCSKTTAIYFGNGVNTTSTGAHLSRALLQIRLRSMLSVENYRALTFKVAYNQTENLLLDLLETARQTLGNEYPILLVGKLLGVTALEDFIIGLILPDGAIQAFNDRLKNRDVQEFLAGASSSVDVATHVASYTSDISEGKKIVLVAHSQGNIFANLSAERLTSDQLRSFAIVPVASPESFVRKSLTGHIRFLDDLVIGAAQVAKIALGLPSPLSPNDQDNVDADFLSHGFREAYMADASASDFVLNAIRTTANLLPLPTSTAAQGTITATLTWGSNPDVDLHVFEPDGFHVFYIQKIGNIGFLDVDVVSSSGPEHYFASCENLRTKPLAIGKYRVGVNYYRGNSPETATVTIKTPGNERTFTKVLSNARGNSGNTAPIPVADITVSKEASTGRLNFMIQGL